MKLTETAETFNLGDTSFRRKTLIDDYRELLPFLLQINDEYENWDNNAQAAYYKRVLTNSDLFERNDNEDLAKRGRTLTNALVKIGLTNEKRKLSRVALNWINGTIEPVDKVEKTLGLDINNIMFMRQLLKLRIYDANGMNFFYPFRVALKMMNKYENIPQQDFLTLIHLIQPNFSEEEINRLIEDYRHVANNNETFSQFLDRAFPDSETNVSAPDLFAHSSLDRALFNQLFINRKSSDTQEVYYEFVSSLLQFKKNKSTDTMKRLLEVASDSKIKKAFGFGKSLFTKKNSVQEFLIENEDNLLLSDDNTEIYNQFVLSKKEDIVKEYRDMTKRTFNLTGLVDFSNGLVNVTNINVTRVIFNKMKLAGTQSYDKYEVNLDFDFYQDITISSILQLNEAAILNELKLIFGVENDNQIETAVANQKEMKFRELIKTEFTKEKILEILPMFSKRLDSEIQKRVSDLATVPTIYEYIIAIAWYYISSEEFSITKSINLTLDGNMRPLSHAAGGEGDIIIEFNDLILMLEVTLMNSQAQKRGEWEPVMRHATNLTVDKYPKNVTTLFIADELDENTINIWRAVASVPLKSSNKDQYAEAVKIFPLTNDDIIDMLKTSKDEKKLLTAIDHSYAKLAGHFKRSWRDEIIDDAYN